MKRFFSSVVKAVVKVEKNSTAVAKIAPNRTLFGGDATLFNIYEKMQENIKKEREFLETAPTANPELLEKVLEEEKMNRHHSIY